jgi:hypothetical protein
MPFQSAHHGSPATFVADSWHAIGVLNYFETHFTQMGPDYILADATTGEFSVQ